MICKFLAMLILLPTTVYGQTVVRHNDVEAVSDVCNPEQEHHNKALVRKFIIEGQSGRNLKIVSEYLSPDFIDHSGASNPNHDPTKQGSLAFHEALFAAFPDFGVVIHQQIAECDRVVTFKTFHGTHKGKFFGFPATNEKMEIDVIDILRVEENQVVDHWVLNNMSERLIAASAGSK